MSSAPVLTITDVAALLGLKSKTISTYLARYDGKPFPVPDGRIGRAPWWLPSRADEIRAWAAARPGRGAGGGPKPRE